MHVDGRRVNNRSFAVELQRAGYATALFGKYLNQWGPYAPVGFDAFFGNGGSQGRAECTATPCTFHAVHC